MKHLVPNEVFDQHIIAIGGTYISAWQAIVRLRENIFVTNECWFWIGYLKNGYGHTEFSGFGIYAHQLSFLLFRGSMPSGKEVCHSCDIRQCVKPDHLFAGTRLENVRDAVRKGLNVSPPRTIGLAQHLAKLTGFEVETIRSLSSQGVSQREIAAQFGCSNSTAWRIANGVTRREA
jgi:Autographiviridae endonuclease